MDKVKFLRNLSDSSPYQGKQVFMSFEPTGESDQYGAKWKLEYVRSDGTSGSIDMHESLYQEFKRMAEEEEAQS